MQGYWKLLVLTAEKLPKAVDPGLSRMEDPTAALVHTHISLPGAGQAASKSNSSSRLDVDDGGVQQGFSIERAPDWKHTMSRGALIHVEENTWQEVRRCSATQRWC